MRFSLITITGLTLVPALVGAQAAPPDSTWVRPSDTVRVWSKTLKVSGARGVVTRAAVDTLTFVAPAGFRKIPREYVGELATIQRLDVLQGRRRGSGWRVLGHMGLGGVIGALTGGLVGVGAGTLLHDVNKANYDNSRTDNRAVAQLMLGALGAGVGATVGVVAGGIDGARAREQWRRVR